MVSLLGDVCSFNFVLVYVDQCELAKKKSLEQISQINGLASCYLLSTWWGQSHLEL